MTVKQRVDPQRRLIKAMAHPLRHRLLIRLNEGAASPSTLARELEEPLGNVAYHVKILLEHDAIELVETKPVRGAIEHIYRATARPYFDDEDWAQVPLSLRQGVLGNTIQTLWEQLAAAGRDGGLDAADTHISWMPLDLDREGYEEMVELLGGLLDRAFEIQAESAGRLTKLPEDERETERTTLAMLHFHRTGD
jgi:DNA-binding transcriptional ArsR family regulator